MNNTYQDLLTKVLKSIEGMVSEDGDILRSKVIAAANKLDEKLITGLLNDKKLKDFFFINIAGATVFDQEKFKDFLYNEEYLADSYTSFKNKIGLATSKRDYLSENNDVVLNWPYKDCVLEGGQDKEDQKRDEVFWNETLGADQKDVLLAPKVLDGFKKYDKDGEHEVESLSEDDNFIIRGNNLLALHTLKKRYAGKVKLVYIDPPFNTGSDGFNYNDRFNHSTWLTFMKNRLEIAKDFLSDDGNIFVHLDSNESHYFRVLMDEVFGVNNFVEEYVWSYGSASGGRAAGAKPVNIHDYIIQFAKNYSSRTQKKLYTPYSQKYLDEWFKFTDEDGRQYRRRMRGKDENGESVWVKQYLDESKGVPLTSVWSDIQQVYADPRAYKEGMEHATELAKGFSGQKPEKLLNRIFEMSTAEGDLVLDYHLGSGTTARVAHKMNRRYIGIEQMFYGDIDPVKRLQKVIAGDQAGISKALGWQGGGSLVNAHLKNDVNVLIEQVKMAKDGSELLTLLETVLSSNFLSHRVDPRKFEAEEFSKQPIQEQKRLLIELVDKNKLYVNYHDMDDARYSISATAKKLNKWMQSRD